MFQQFVFKRQIIRNENISECSSSEVTVHLLSDGKDSGHRMTKLSVAQMRLVFETTTVSKSKHFGEKVRRVGPK